MAYFSPLEESYASLMKNNSQLFHRQDVVWGRGSLGLGESSFSKPWVDSEWALPFSGCRKCCCFFSFCTSSVFVTFVSLHRTSGCTTLIPDFCCSNSSRGKVSQVPPVFRCPPRKEQTDYTFVWLCILAWLRKKTNKQRHTRASA